MPFWTCNNISWPKTLAYSATIVLILAIVLFTVYNCTNDMAPAIQIGAITLSGFAILVVSGMIESVFEERIMLKRPPEFPMMPKK